MLPATVNVSNFSGDSTLVVKIAFALREIAIPINVVFTNSTHCKIHSVAQYGAQLVAQFRGKMQGPLDSLAKKSNLYR